MSRKGGKIENTENYTGEKNGHSKLNWEKVNYIRQNYKKGVVKMDDLASQMGVTRGCISHVIRRRVWNDGN